MLPADFAWPVCACGERLVMFFQFDIQKKFGLPFRGGQPFLGVHVPSTQRPAGMDLHGHGPTEALLGASPRPRRGQEILSTHPPPPGNRGEDPPARTTPPPAIHHLRETRGADGGAPNILVSAWR